MIEEGPNILDDEERKIIINEDITELRFEKVEEKVLLFMVLWFETVLY